MSAKEFCRKWTSKRSFSRGCNANGAPSPVLGTRAWLSPEDSTIERRDTTTMPLTGLQCPRVSSLVARKGLRLSPGVSQPSHVIASPSLPATSTLRAPSAHNHLTTTPPMLDKHKQEVDEQEGRLRTSLHKSHHRCCLAVLTPCRYLGKTLASSTIGQGHMSTWPYPVIVEVVSSHPHSSKQCRHPPIKERRGAATIIGTNYSVTVTPFHSHNSRHTLSSLKLFPLICTAASNVAIIPLTSGGEQPPPGTHPTVAIVAPSHRHNSCSCPLHPISVHGRGGSSNSTLPLTSMRVASPLPTTTIVIRRGTPHALTLRM